jgi:hypothetical protein
MRVLFSTGPLSEEGRNGSPCHLLSPSLSETVSLPIITISHPVQIHDSITQKSSFYYSFKGNFAFDYVQFNLKVARETNRLINIYAGPKGNE